VTAREPSRPDILTDAAKVAQRSVAEDGPLDITNEVLGVHAPALGKVVPHQQMIVAGLVYASAVCDLLECRVDWHTNEGTPLTANSALGTVRGSLDAVLRAERPMLNLLQRASGIATLTHAYVDAVAGTGCRVLHTRKTAPGLRLFDVCAVVAGGGFPHRLGLDREVMIKDNHWLVMQSTGRSLQDMLAAATERGVTACHVEVESADQVRIAIEAGATRLLIDNQSPVAFRTLVETARACSPGVEIEATGGLSLDTVRAYAEAGAEFVSVGALTHSVPAANIGMEVELEG
jgi:nicotinate-nucleotide pyrophosphorylase (carboxylating)